jgi:hypothetical protein
MDPGERYRAIEHQAHGRPVSRSAFSVSHSTGPLPGSGTDAREGRLHRRAIDPIDIRDQARHRFAVTGDDDLFALLNAVEQAAERFLGLEGTICRMAPTSKKSSLI